jgi:hypothetical protein
MLGLTTGLGIGIRGTGSDQGVKGNGKKGLGAMEFGPMAQNIHCFVLILGAQLNVMCGYITLYYIYFFHAQCKQQKHMFMS